MALYWKAAGAVLLAVVMILVLRRQEMGLLLCVCVCAMTAMAAVEYLDPVLELLDSLQAAGSMDTQMVAILLKAVGIGLVTEIACTVCADSGNASLGKTLQLLGTAVVLWMAVPLFQALLEMIGDILGEL